jgi:amidase
MAAAHAIIFHEVWTAHRSSLPVWSAELGSDVLERLELGATLDEDTVASARSAQAVWMETMASQFARFPLLALPTLPDFPRHVDDPQCSPSLTCTRPVSLAGLPAIAIPVRVPGAQLPASLQLIGPALGEDLLLAAAAAIEEACGSAGRS